MVSLWEKTSETQSSFQIPMPGEVAGAGLSPHELLRPSLQGRALHPGPISPLSTSAGEGANLLPSSCHI